MATATRSSATLPAPTPRPSLNAENLQRVHERTTEVLAELARAYSRYQQVWSSRQSRAAKEAWAASSSPSSDSAPTSDDTLSAAHGALVLAFAQGQRLLRTLNWVLTQRTADGAATHTQPVASTMAATPDAAAPHALTRLRQQQTALTQLLPRVALLLDKHAREGDASDSAADAAAALRSLLHTRSLLSTELQKVDSVVQGLAGSSESVNLLHQTLQDVSTTVEMAQEVLKQLLVVKSKEDVVLRVSAVVFVLVVLYILAQRVLGFFPVTRYVRL